MRLDDTMMMAGEAVPAVAGIDAVLLANHGWGDHRAATAMNLARALALRGGRVLFVEGGAAARPLLARGRMAEPAITVLSPPRARWVEAVAATARRLRLDAPLLWAFHPYGEAVPGRLAHGGLVYAPQADDQARAADGEGWRVAERRFLERCDAVFVTDARLLSLCRRHNGNVHLIGDAAHADHFFAAFEASAPPPALAGLPAPRLGFVGGLAEGGVDLPLLAGIMQAHPDWHLVLLGGDPAGTPLAGMANVHALPMPDFASLPAIFAGLDVGLLPADTALEPGLPVTQRLTEYFAAGVPVAATALRAAIDSRGPVAIGNDATSFARAIARQLKRGRLTRAEALIAVGDTSWNRRLGRMLAALPAQAKAGSSGG